ncbi:hypothetical protein [Persicitalea sp.]|uniref:hypothetical protein n=1 Tax=Persicitalea sp. TaxID=3100273 RepID=UPI0035942A8C
MKKLWLLAMLGGLGCGLPVRGQIQDGTRYWGGTVKLEGNTSTDRVTDGTSTQSASRHTITPELQWGKFINSNTMIGVGVRYNFSLSKTIQEFPGTSNNDFNATTFGQSIALLPFIRKYKTLNEHWAVFIHGEIGPLYNWDRSKNSVSPQPENKNRSWEYELGIKPGLVYFFPKRNVAIEGYAGILSLFARYSPYNDNSGRGISLSTGLSTRFPDYFTLRIAKYIPAKNQPAQP